MNIINWFKESHRWQHIVVGLAIGIASDDWYSTAVAAVPTASALEYKDKEYGNYWDWVDWSLTVAGAAGGFVISLIIKTFLL
jgi:hypothetical protein